MTKWKPNKIPKNAIYIDYNDYIILVNSVRFNEPVEFGPKNNGVEDGLNYLQFGNTVIAFNRPDENE